MWLPGNARGRCRGLRVNRTAFLLAVGVVLAVGGVKLAQPLSVARRQQDELARLRRDKANEQAQQARLERYQRELATDRGLERAARREGYLRTGERRLVFTREAAPPSESRLRSPRPAPREPHEGSRDQSR